MELELIATALNQSMGNIIEFIGKSLAGIATIGTFSMAFVQMVKASPIRALYFQFRLRRFLQEKDLENANKLENLICLYSTGGKPEFYAQTLPEIVQGIASIKNLAIAWPTNNKFSFFLRFFEMEAANILIEEDNLSNDKKSEVTAFLDKSITAQIDGFNVLVKRRWTLYQQLTAMLISTGLIIILAPIDNPVLLFLYGVFGGFIAPFAHDIIKKIKSS